ncbi:MAG: hypothetical protein LAP13_26820, partial [Acidobacteriia bacterium]|nr:hypothetical protein [Terriglobia bacterium]
VIRYENGKLTIQAHNSTLSDILRAVSKQTGAVIDFPPEANERVNGQTGPGPVAVVLDRLLGPLSFDYAILGSAANPNGPVRVILSAKAGSSTSPQQVQGQGPQPTQASGDLAPAETGAEEASEDQYWRARQNVQQDLIGRLNARGKQTDEDSQPQKEQPPQ